MKTSSKYKNVTDSLVATSGEGIIKHDKIFVDLEEVKMIKFGFKDFNYTLDTERLRNILLKEIYKEDIK